ncbi:MAG TPA: TlyA family RNA methyltransferase [Candidatus Polarisedimenticolaceae bacterium]|nr:TlyA family RNA methyltransferase [Candidatus Polarisedimenticolaceae bacterium]
MVPGSKQRLDLLLVERGLAPTRTAGQAMIMAGEVVLGTDKLTKPGMMILADADIEVSARPRYVSRGGDKLASVAGALNLDFSGKVVLDVGSSTGGFTDFCLQQGAKRVYAVDVGTAQLAYQLRQDARVVVLERTDIRALNPGQLDPRPEMAVIDVSFISLTKILTDVADLIAPDGQIIAMAKPQFEADKPTADRYKGIIKDEVVRAKILAGLEASMKYGGFTIAASADSAVHGARGNRERFYVLKRNSTTSSGLIT